MKNLELHTALQLLKEDKSRVFKGTKKMATGYTILKILDCHNEYPEFINYAEDGTKEIQIRQSFNGMISFDMVWELVKEPITFNEALKSNKRIKCEHELINKLEKDRCICNDSMILNYMNKIKKGDYLYINQFLVIIGWMLSSIDVKQVLEEGEFYLED